MSTNKEILYGVGAIIAIAVVYACSQNQKYSNGYNVFKPMTWLTSPGMGYVPGMFPSHAGAGMTNYGTFHPWAYAQQIGNPRYTTRYSRDPV